MKIIIGNGRKYTENMLETSKRLDLTQIDHIIQDGKAYISFLHYKRMYEVAHVAENQVEGLETMIQLGVPFDNRNFDQNGSYPAHWLNEAKQPIGLKPLLEQMKASATLQDNRLTKLFELFEEVKEMRKTRADTPVSGEQIEFARKIGEVLNTVIENMTISKGG